MTSHSVRFLLLGSLPSSLRNFRGALISEIVSRGYEVYAAAPGLQADISTSAWLSERGVKCKNAPLNRTGLNPLLDLLTLIALVRLMKQVRPKFFLGYTAKPVVWGLTAAWLIGTPNRIALITGLGYAFTGRAKGKRAFVQVIVRLLYRLSLRRATLIFFQNSDDRKDFEKLGLLPEGVPVFVVSGSGVDTSHFAMTPFPGTPFRFLLIARLIGDKGVREYRAAAALVKAKYPTVEFHLVGGIDPNPDGIAEEEVKAWHQSGDVVWHGALTDVRPVIEKSHVYVLPSYREGMPRTVLEAMSMGRAVITTDVPGCRDTVTEGFNGYLVGARNSVELADRMCWLIENPSVASVMGERSRQIAEERYDVRIVNASMLREMGL